MERMGNSEEEERARLEALAEAKLAELGPRLDAAREAAGHKNKSRFGRELGWTDNTNVLRVAKGGDTSVGAAFKWADKCGYELLFVRQGSAESLLARAQNADERELELAIEILDFLAEFRDDPRSRDHLRIDVDLLRQKLALHRGLTPAG